MGASQGFDGLDFHPLGHRAETKNPVRDLRRLLIIAPFVGSDLLAELADQVREDIALVGRPRCQPGLTDVARQALPASQRDCSVSRGTPLASQPARDRTS